MIAVIDPVASTAMKRFTLSKSQQDDLRRGQPLQIAIPMRDVCDPGDELRLAREWLELPDEFQIVAAEVQEIDVSAPVTGDSRSNLTEILGSILRDDADRSQPFVVVRHVVLMAIVRGSRDANKWKPPQWPNGRIEQ